MGVAAPLARCSAWDSWPPTSGWLVELLQYRRRRRHALLVWEGARPKYYGLNLALGAVFGVLLAVNVFWLRRPLRDLFGELMMLTYYGYAFPLSVRIARGFYEDGVWSDSGFLKWAQISAVSWKEEGSVTLVLISHVRSIARRLDVPGHLYGQARRLLRDRIKSPRDAHGRGRAGPRQPGRAGRGVTLAGSRLWA